MVEGLGADGAQDAERHVDVALGACVVEVGVQGALVFVVAGPRGFKAGGGAVDFKHAGGAWDSASATDSSEAKMAVIHVPF